MKRRRFLFKPVPRRAVLRGGLAGLATAVMSPVLGACDGDPPAMDAAVDAGPGLDSGIADAGADAGTSMFPVRDVPPPPVLRSLIADLGDLGDPDANGVRLPAGFTSRVVARSGEAVGPRGYVWHNSPDGGAVFGAEDGGWMYVSNAELPIIGGASAIRFDPSGEIVDAYAILEGTEINCAGGKTPWHTWLSCEERPVGVVWETDPWGEVGAVVRPALGTFKHEAAAYDLVNDHIYLSEDQDDGAFYRFVPDRMTSAGLADLSSGTLQVAEVEADGTIRWHAVPEPNPPDGTLSTRNQVPQSTAFDGGEGIWWHDGVVYLATKGDDRVWAYDVPANQMSVIYDGEAVMDPPLVGVDNLTVSCCGDVLVAEDGGTLQIVAILPSGELKPVMQLVGQPDSRISGPGFDPSGTRLYFSSQWTGLIYEITGPFHEPV